MVDLSVPAGQTLIFVIFGRPIVQLTVGRVRTTFGASGAVVVKEFFVRTGGATAICTFLLCESGIVTNCLMGRGLFELACTAGRTSPEVTCEVLAAASTDGLCARCRSEFALYGEIENGGMRGIGRRGPD